MVWGDMSMEGRTDLGNGNLTAIKYWGDIHGHPDLTLALWVMSVQ